MTASGRETAGSTSLGLSAEAEAVYRVAVGHGWWEPPALVAAAVASGTCPEQAEAAVAQLVDLGLLRLAERDGADGLRVRGPRVVLEGQLGRARELVQRQQQELDDATRLLSDLEASYSSGVVENTFEELVGLDAVRLRLEHLAGQARSEVLAFLPGGAHSPAALEASRPLDERALAAGVQIRNVYLHSAVNDPATAAYVRWLHGLGAETRTVATLPMRMLVIDREVAVIPLDVERPRLGALVVRNPGIVTALLALFEAVWASGRAVGGRRESVDVELSDTDLAILRLLSTGATDEGLARHLGVSVRTVRRLTSALMTRFSARSRFEFGLRLGRQDGIDLGG